MNSDIQNSEDMESFPRKTEKETEELKHLFDVETMYPETCALCNQAKIMKVPMAPELCGFCAFKQGIYAGKYPEADREAFGDHQVTNNPKVNSPKL